MTTTAKRPVPAPLRQSTGPHAVAEVPQPFGVVNSDGTQPTTIAPATSSKRAPLLAPTGMPGMPGDLPA